MTNTEMLERLRAELASRGIQTETSGGILHTAALLQQATQTAPSHPGSPSIHTTQNNTPLGSSHPAGLASLDDSNFGKF